MKNKELDLTQGSIAKNLMKLSVPIMLSNFFQMFYNLTDTFWLGKIGDNARNAVATAGMTFPLIWFISSLGFGFVVAGTSLTAQYKGAGKMFKIRELTGQFILILLLFSIFYLLFSFFLLDNILQLMNTPENILNDAKAYISVILFGMLFMFIFMIYQSFAHGLGDTYTPMIIQLISVSINVVLDPFMIFGIGFFPRMEIVGAAYATLIARFAGAGLALFYFVFKTKDLVPSLNDMIPQKEMMKKIINIAVPASLSQSMTSFGFLILQGFVNFYGTVAMSAYSIGNRIVGIFMMPSMGISNALSSVIGQNLGAGNIERAEKSVWTALKIVAVIMIIGCTLVFFFGGELTKFFIKDAKVIEAGKRMFKVLSFAAAVFSVIFVFIGVFNGSGHTAPAMKFTISRLWIFRIPLVYILSGHLLIVFGIDSGIIYRIISVISKPLQNYPYDALWWSMLISNIITAFWSYSIFKKGTWKKAKINLS